MEYITHLAILVCIYSILGISLNLLVGYTGLLFVAQAAFYGIGAYTVAILGTQFGINFFVSVLVGIVVSGAFALAIGIVLNRFSGDYFALGSLGFNAIIFSIFLNAQEITRGPLGIPGIPRPSILGFPFTASPSFFLLALFFLTLVYLCARFIVKSSLGRVLKAIREDEEAIQAFGYNTLRFKLALCSASAAMASVAGALFASYITFIDPTGFNVSESILILTIIILGGLASLRGSLLGALFLILLPELLRFVGFPIAVAAQMRQVFYGILLILLMLYRPQGIVGKYKL